MRSAVLARLPRSLPDRCALAVILAAAVIAALTFDDYGLGWDDFTHSQYGDLLYRYFASGLTHTRVFSFVNLYYYGGGFDLAAAAIGRVIPLDIFDIRRLLGASVGIFGLIIVWRTGRRVGGPVCGLFAVCLLLICPLYFGHIFMNAKDAPFAVAVAGLIYTLVRALDEYPKPTWRTAALFGVSFGLAIGTRVLGMITLVYGALAFSLLITIEWRTLGLKPALLRFLGFLALLAMGLPLAYFVLGIVWPWGVLDPLNPIRALTYYSNFWEVPWRELFDGKTILVPDMPRTYRADPRSRSRCPNCSSPLSLSGMAGALVGGLLRQSLGVPPGDPDAGGLGCGLSRAAHRRHPPGDVQRHPAFRVRHPGPCAAGGPFGRLGVRVPAPAAQGLSGRRPRRDARRLCRADQHLRRPSPL